MQRLLDRGQLRLSLESLSITYAVLKCSHRPGKGWGGGEGGILPGNLGGGVRRDSGTSYPFQTKICDFPYPISDLPKISYPISDQILTFHILYFLNFKLFIL